MRRVRSTLFAMALIPALASCNNFTGPLTDPDAPANLSYQLIPSGDPNAPSGILLMWNVPRSGQSLSLPIAP